jgi:hypothetical protein
LPEVLRLLLFLLLLLAPDISRSAGAPMRPPCGDPPVPAYAPVGQPPVTEVWSESELRRSGWDAPGCLNWGASRSRLVAALAGQFQFAGSIDELVARIGRISGLKTVRYWSVSHKAWQELVSDAGVLEEPQGRARPDVSSSELVPGRSFFYFEVSHSGRTVYRLTVRERAAQRFVVATENVTAIRIGILTAFEPGAMQSVVFLEKLGPGLWGYYQTIRATAGASALALGSDASYINRLAALYRYVAGIPTDQKPPLAR